MLRSLIVIAGIVAGKGSVVWAQSEDALDFVEVVKVHFQSWDADANSELSKKEIDLSVSNPKIVGKEAAAIAALQRSVRNSKLKLPVLTEANLRELALTGPKAEQPNLGKLYRDSLTRLGRVKSRNMFADGVPRLDTIHQGKLGNCFCLAPLGAKLARDPKEVADMFASQPDGTCCVTLGARKVIVAMPTDAELAMTSSNEQECVWLNVYEKAVGEALNQNRDPEKRVTTPIDILARGGSAGTMLSFITGNKIERFSLKFMKDKDLPDAVRDEKFAALRKQLTAATQEKRLMTCGTLKTTTPGMTPNHAYAILGYDPVSDMLRVWNPHGSSFTPTMKPASFENGYPRHKGVFSIPLPEFARIFSGLAFEVKEMAAN